ALTPTNQVERGVQMKLRPGRLAPCLLACLLACSAVVLRAASAAERSTLSCAGVRSHADEWVTASVDALVRAAHAAYERDEAEPAYTRLLGRLAGTLKRCELSQDAGFVQTHREFVVYVETASPATLPDHELGFAV